MPTYIVRLWLPDIPGTLGRVAAAIGKTSGDVIGIEILERGAGMAIDELLVALPDADLVDGMIAEISSVEGVAIEDVHAVAPDRSDQSVLALEVAANIMEALPRNVCKICAVRFVTCWKGSGVPFCIKVREIP